MEMDYHSLVQVTAACISYVGQKFLQESADVQGEPAERKDQDQTENGPGDLPPLQNRKRTTFQGRL